LYFIAYIENQQVATDRSIAGSGELKQIFQVKGEAGFAVSGMEEYGMAMIMIIFRDQEIAFLRASVWQKLPSPVPDFHAVTFKYLWLPPRARLPMTELHFYRRITLVRFLE